MGNSTSAHGYGGIKEWGYFLSEKLSANGDYHIVNYAIGAADSNIEFNKLFRDVIYDKPDIVIVYSGVNDTKDSILKGHPSVPIWLDKIIRRAFDKKLINLHPNSMVNVKGITYGSKRVCSRAQHWVENIRNMHGICSEYGIDFIGILQPHRMTGGYIRSEYENDIDTKIYFEDINDFYNEIRQEIEKIDYIYDLSDIFDGMKDIFFDRCHVLERGNIIIANKIEDIVKEERINSKTVGN